MQQQKKVGTTEEALFRRATKKDAIKMVLERSPGENVDSFIPPSDYTGLEIFLYNVFPPGLEDYVASKDHKGVIIELREKLRQELANSLLPNCRDNSNFLLAASVCSPYVEKLYTILGGMKKVVEVFDQIPFVKKTRENVDHNIKIQKKIDEYQTRACQFGGCGKTGPWNMWCSRCQKVRYCSTNCQKSDWPNHKKNCHANPDKSVESN